MNLRALTLGDHSSFMKIARLRHEVYVREQGKLESFAATTSKFSFETEDVTAHRNFFVMSSSSQIWGAVRMSLEPPWGKMVELDWEGLLRIYGSTGAYVSRLVVDKRRRNQRVVRVLVQAVAAECARIGVRFVILNCARRYLRLYMGLGFEEYSQPFIDVVAGVQFPLILRSPSFERLSATAHSSVFGVSKFVPTAW